MPRVGAIKPVFIATISQHSQRTSTQEISESRHTSLITTSYPRIRDVAATPPPFAQTRCGCPKLGTGRGTGGFLVKEEAPGLRKLGAALASAQLASKKKILISKNVEYIICDESRIINNKQYMIMLQACLGRPLGTLGLQIRPQCPAASSAGRSGRPPGITSLGPSGEERRECRAWLQERQKDS